MIRLAPVIRLYFPPLRIRLSTGNWVVLMVGLGLVLRLIHFLRLPSVWHDEAAVLINVLQLDFRQMLGPLLVHEAAPPLFLMAERVMFHLLGDGVLALRLLPLLASCGSLLLVALIAQRILSDRAAPWAVALFAVSDRLLWHSVEAKPYAIDVFVAAGIIYFYLATRHWPLWKRGLPALPVLPMLIWLSFPACFIIGGLFVGQLPALLRSRSWRDWLVSFILVVAVGCSFLALASGPVAAQRDGAMESCWTQGFSDWQRPWTIPLWAANSTLDVFNYAIPSQGWLLAGVIVAGGNFFWRHREGRLLAVMLVPMALAFVASLLGKYPYCGMRVLVYMTPAICLLAAAGLPPSLEWCRRRSRWAVVALALVLVIPFAHTARRTVFPWPRADNANACRHVLANWQPGDRVGFNNWEGQYYFRKQADVWFDQTQTGERLWYVAVCPDAAIRSDLLNGVAPGWVILERHEYAGVSVALFVPEEP